MSKSWRDSMPSSYLKAGDFEKPALLTIRGFGDEKIGDEIKPCVFFEEETKGLILNIINGNTIEDTVGSPDPEHWKGHHIVAFKSKTEFKGKLVDCIRLRAPKPGAQAPEPEPLPDDDVPFGLFLPFLLGAFFV